MTRGPSNRLGTAAGTVFSFSMKVCGQREDAEDTMQEVLVKAIPYLPKFESPAHFSSGSIKLPRTVA